MKKSLDYHGPPKRKYIWANQAPFMKKELNKEIMTRSRLRNKFLRFRSEENKKAYNEQRNRCVKVTKVTVVLSSLEMSKNFIIAILT